MKYKFLGKPDNRVSFYKTGKVYDLEIEEVKIGLFESASMWMMGITRPLIINPIRCPYSSWETFYENWKLIK
jgi:hypothetical protein